MIKSLFLNKKAFSLIEIIVSLALLGIMAITILPIFNFGLQSSMSHRQSMMATQIASNQLEWLRTLRYSDEGDKEAELGLIGGFTPSGIVNPDLYRNKPDSDPFVIDGIEYRVRTRISWEDDVSITGRVVDDARKKVDVIVYTYNPFTGAEKEFSILGTMFTFEGQQSPTQQGVRVVVYRRVVDEDSRAERVLMEMSGNQHALTYTDNDGRAIFPDLPQGTGNTYYFLPKAWDFGEMMVRPLDVEDIPGSADQRWVKQLEVNDVPNQISFVVDSPAYLRFFNKDNLPGDTSITISSDTGDIDDIDDMKLDLNNIDNLKFWPVWNYDYLVESNDEYEYYIAHDKEEKGEWSEWDGYFAHPRNTPSYKDVLLHFGFKYADVNDKKIDGSIETGDKEISIVIDEDTIKEETPYAKIIMNFTAPLNDNLMNKRLYIEFFDDTDSFTHGDTWLFDLNTESEENGVFFFEELDSMTAEQQQKLYDGNMGYSIEIDDHQIILTIIDKNFDSSDFYDHILTGNQLHVLISTPNDYEEFEANKEMFIRSTSNIPLWGYYDIDNSKSHGVLREY